MKAEDNGELASIPRDVEVGVIPRGILKGRN
jgi:hypothetical protein